MQLSNPKELKIGEKLKILSSKLKCVLNQLYHIKENLLDKGLLNSILTESQFESANKTLLKKFPSVDIKGNRVAFEPFIRNQDRIITELSFHYNTMVDGIVIKEKIISLIGEMSAYGYQLNIQINYDMTVHFLNLIADYCCMLLIIKDTPEMKQILGIYNVCMLSKFEQDGMNYPKICERFIEKQKDNCITEFYNELNPFSKTIQTALLNLDNLLKVRRMSTSEWDKIEFFKVIHEPSNDKIFHMKRADFLPQSQIERWIVFGTLSVYPELLKNNVLLDNWKKALENSFIFNLHRSLPIKIHSCLLRFFDSLKGYSKISGIIKDSFKEISGAVQFHKSRRNYLRMVMRHQIQVLVDFPGFMAPNISLLCMTIGIAVDEVNWLICHKGESQPKKFSNIKLNPDDLDDNQIPEMLFQIEEIRYLLTKFGINKTYYYKVIVNHDIPKLKNFIESVKEDLNEEELIIFNNFCTTALNLELRDEQETDLKPFKPVRLDWLRLQTYLSQKQSKFHWYGQFENIRIVNTFITHTHIYDNFDNFLDKYCSLKFLLFHKLKLTEWFKNNLKYMPQHRYSIVFARVCSHFIKCCHTDCPDDFNFVLKTTNDLVVNFLQTICRELSNKIVKVIQLIFELDSKMFPHSAVEAYLNYFLRKKGNSKNNASDVNSPTTSSEDQSLNAATSSCLEQQLMMIHHLATCLNSRSFYVNGIEYRPYIYIQKELTLILSAKLISLSTITRHKKDKQTVCGHRRPSEMVTILRIMMNLITKVNEFVNFSPSHVFNHIFLSQSLSTDIYGRETLTEVYCKWYLDELLEQPNILYTPVQNMFITNIPPNTKDTFSTMFLIDDYTDIEEMRAFVTLLGPFGMKILNEKLMQKIIKNVCIIRRFISRNQVILKNLECVNIDNQKLKSTLHELQDLDGFCSCLHQMGILFAFKGLCHQALAHITQKSLPFLKSTVENLQQDFEIDQSDRLSSVSEHEEPIYHMIKRQIMVYDLCHAFGLKTKIDGSLFMELENKLREQRLAQDDQTERNDDAINDMLLLATALLIPNLVGSSVYKIDYEAFDNNAHCCAYAIKELWFSFFGPSGEDTMKEKIKKFLALASANLLRLGMETTTTNKEESIFINNRDSIYIFFDFITQTFEIVSADFYEECFPYALVRQAYHNVAKTTCK